MKISRRDFLKWTVAASVALKLNLDFGKINTLLAADTDPPVIWLQGAGCTGCTVSLLNVTNPTTIDDVLINKISMKSNSTIMAFSGNQAMQALSQAATQYQGQFILVVEGAIPTGSIANWCIVGDENGVELTMRDAVLRYAPMARFVVAAGTCASFGGVPAAGPSGASFSSVKSLVGTQTVNPVVNLSGCPVHPTVLVQTLLDLLLSGVPRLDSNNRPASYYGSSIHQQCPRRGTGQAQPGQVGCYKNIGCKGPNTSYICPTLKWNNTNFCTNANYPCHGCTEPTFPTNPLTS